MVHLTCFQSSIKTVSSILNKSSEEDLIMKEEETNIADADPLKEDDMPDLLKKAFWVARSLDNSRG